MGVDDLRTPDKWMAIASALLLAGYFAFALYAMSSPSNDPQRGMAQGFIIFVACASYLPLPSSLPLASSPRKFS
jgi:hypothetical protein